MRGLRQVLVATAFTGSLIAMQPALTEELFLLKAVQQGDISALESLLQTKADVVNVARADGTTALAWAVYRDNQKATELLLRAGADANIANENGVTPLTLACLNNNPGIIQALLDAGADPNLAKITGITPLMTCANSGSSAGVDLLLKRGAMVNVMEARAGQTALMWAIVERHPEIVQLLVDNGADIHTRSKEIPEPEPYVIEIEPGKSVWGSNYPAKTKFRKMSGGFTPMHFVAQQGEIETARILLNAGADVNSPHAELGNPLLIAMVSGHNNLAKFLLEQGANPNIKDLWGVTPLHYAQHQGLLILSGFRPQISDRLGWERPSMTDMIEVLLDHDADPNAQIEYEFPFLDNPFVTRSNISPSQISIVGATPILLAAASGNIDAMNLLEEVSNIHAKTDAGASLLMLAAGAGAERGVRNEDEAIEAAKLAMALGVTDVNLRLTELAPDGPAKGKGDGRTLLHFAADLGWTKLIRFLAENGADLDVEDRYGQTPLTIALGDPELRYYRNVGDGDYDHRYRRIETRPNPGVAELLLELGAQPFTREVISRGGRSILRQADN